MSARWPFRPTPRFWFLLAAGVFYLVIFYLVISALWAVIR